MKTYLLWILVSVNPAGQVSKVEEFPTITDCRNAIIDIKREFLFARTDLQCIHMEVARKE
jgi:hypothetical protein